MIPKVFVLNHKEIMCCYPHVSPSFARVILCVAVLLLNRAASEDRSGKLSLKTLANRLNRFVLEIAICELS